MRVDVYLTDGLSAQTPTTKNAHIQHWLNQHLDVDDQSAPLVIKKNARGKPLLEAPHQHHAISITHSQTLLMLAISHEVSWLGVDAESMSRPIHHDASRLAQRFFHPNEHHIINNLATDQQSSAFLKLWTMKEALLKGLGHGLSGHMNRIRFDWDQPSQDWRLDPATVSSNTSMAHVLRLPSEHHWFALSYGTSANQADTELMVHFHPSNHWPPS